MSDDNPLDHPEVQLGTHLEYTIGALLSIVLCAIALGLAYGHALAPTVMMAVLTFIAFGLMFAQLYFFLSPDISEGHRWKLYAGMFSVPLFVLMIALTMWTFYMLALRTAVAVG